jgi:hypothetical protein
MEQQLCTARQPLRYMTIAHLPTVPRRPLLITFHDHELTIEAVSAVQDGNNELTIHD